MHRLFLVLGKMWTWILLIIRNGKFLL